jgi:hypothetical protein
MYDPFDVAHKQPYLCSQRKYKGTNNSGTEIPEHI